MSLQVTISIDKEKIVMFQYSLKFPKQTSSSKVAKIGEHFYSYFLFFFSSSNEVSWQLLIVLDHNLFHRGMITSRIITTTVLLWSGFLKVITQMFQQKLVTSHLQLPIRPLTTVCLAWKQAL